MPADGGEACRYADLGHSAADFDASRLSGTWFLVAETRRLPGVVLDEPVISASVDNKTANFTYSFFNRYGNLPPA